MSGTIDQLLVRVWKACNFRCNFCNVSANERHVKMKEAVDDIVRNFHYKFKYSDITDNTINVTISWWEPSIFQKEVIFALKYIQAFCSKRDINVNFDMQTNGSNIDLDFARKIKSLWIKKAMVSFHTIDPKIFDEVIGIPYHPNFDNILIGIDNLKSVGIHVSFNTILSKQNIQDFFPTIKFLLDRYWVTENNMNIGIIQPHGEAAKQIDEICPKYDQIEGIYNKTIGYLRRLWQPVESHFVWLPPCYLSHKQNSTEVESNVSFRRTFDHSQKSLINQINDTNKTHIKACNRCIYKNVCSWIWHEYVWYQTLRPEEYKRIFYDEIPVPEYTFTSMKRLYDNNVRQIIIKTSQWDIDDLRLLIKEANNIWFYQVSLLVDSDIELNEQWLETGISNIQVDISCVSIDFLLQLNSFSQKNPSQLRVDIDIFIKKYDIQSVEKLQKILHLFPSDYIHIFFIYFYVNKNIYKYISLLDKLEIYKNNINTVNFYKPLLYRGK